MPQIKIYSTEWCSFCKAEKRFLKEHHVTFEDINVEANQTSAHEMFELSGQLGVPFTLITHDDGKITKIIGFDQPKLTHALGITKTHAA